MYHVSELSYASNILTCRPETEEYGISSFVYRSRRPFHPARLMDFINLELAGEDEEEKGEEGSEGHIDVTSKASRSVTGSEQVILRSKGFFWLATRYEENLVWSQAGGLFRYLVRLTIIMLLF